MIKPFRVLARKEIYRSYVLRLIHEELSYKGQRIIRATLLHPGAVVVLPMLPDGRIVMVRQYRHAIKRWLLELPAGVRDRRETPAKCARRELEEETGWRATRLRRLTRFYAAPGCLSELMILYLATGLRPGTARPELDETVSSVTLTLPAALRKIRAGEICDAKTIIGMFWLARMRGA